MERYFSLSYLNFKCDKNKTVQLSSHTIVFSIITWVFVGQQIRGQMIVNFYCLVLKLGYTVVKAQQIKTIKKKHKQNNVMESKVKIEVFFFLRFKCSLLWSSKQFTENGTVATAFYTFINNCFALRIKIHILNYRWPPKTSIFIPIRKG